jgi:hypothetical protein
MSTQTIEIHIREVLTGEAQRLALNLAAYLTSQGMQFERGTGYWEDKRYWHIKYKNSYVCFILVNGFGSVRHKNEPEGWIIWSDDYDSDLFANYPLDERTKEIAWKHIDICGKCGGCKNPGGSHKTIFGKDFDNVCITTFRFDNPDAETVECVKKLLEIRKKHIDFSKITACGECCYGCKKQEDGLCEGCIESDGHCKEWTQSKGCPIYKCAKKHKVQFCGLCFEFPCKWLVEKVTWNPNIVVDLTKLAKRYKEIRR